MQLPPSVASGRPTDWRRLATPVCSMPITQRGGLGWSPVGVAESEWDRRLGLACGSAPGPKSSPRSGRRQGAGYGRC
jgi:hypothetical protein